MIEDEIAKARQRIKGMQLRRDKAEEAKAQADLGLMHLEAIRCGGDRAENLEAAGVAFARAKRLCRDLQRQKDGSAKSPS